MLNRRSRRPEPYRSPAGEAPSLLDPAWAGLPRRHGGRRPLLPSGVLDRRARHHDDARAGARRRARDRHARSPGARRIPGRRRRSASTARRRRSSSSRAAARTRSRACCAIGSTPLTPGASGTSGKAKPTRRSIRFTPDGQPYGFVETLKEDAPGAALDGAEARRRAEAEATARWNVDLAPFGLVEQGQERRPGGRIDHTAHLRALVADPRRGPLSAQARGLRRSADGSHPLRPDP